MPTDRTTETREQPLPTSPALEERLDLEFEAFCAREGDENVTLEEVRKATAGIPGSMAEAVINEERAERFSTARSFFDR